MTHQEGLPHLRQVVQEILCPEVVEELPRDGECTPCQGDFRGSHLGDLCALDSDSALRRRLRHYARPHLLVIDEVGYLSYSNRPAHLMFELISRRYQNESTLATTNRTFAEWRELFPNAACVVSLVDCLLHNSEIVARGLRRGRLSMANLSPQGSPRPYRTTLTPAPRP
jgi:IstB-like ATP binding protein